QLYLSFPQEKFFEFFLAFIRLRIALSSFPSTPLCLPLPNFQITLALSIKAAAKVRLLTAVPNHNRPFRLIPV
ncbi:hypothetical protein LT679_04860, partial [Mucilaginibacter roseus]